MQSPTIPVPNACELIMQTQSRVQPQQWVVRTRGGSVVGHVKSLTICHCSKQIVSALLVLRNSGQQVQIPWNRFDMVEDDAKSGGGKINNNDPAQNLTLLVRFCAVID